MKMFTLKAFLLVCLMFVSVLFGMQQANEGIHIMKGYNDADFKGAFTVQESGSGELEASVLGNEVSSHDLQQKKEKLEELKAFNFFASLGKNISDGLSAAAERAIQLIMDLIA